MQFTEITFALFLPIVFSIYWLALRRCFRLQNVMLLAASYTFYGWWDWRFLGLIILTTITTYLTALCPDRRLAKWLAAGNITLNLGILTVFKYFNFFSDNLQKLFGLFGWNLDWFSLEVLLPVGISFYTFQAISYSVDVCKGRVKPCADPIVFATFIAYFPQLVAGPIERASQLIPQIARRRQWDSGYAADGLRMILYGVMKKVCIADMLAIYVDRLYEGTLDNPLSTLAAGVLFSLEIYCDFSAYSEIARGVSRLLGIELMANFRFPFFSRNIFEFWHRWHISLMCWFKDYVYIPLGGNRKGTLRGAVNISAVFLLSGLWHGAAWNFIVWGGYWAIVYVIGRYLLKLNRKDGAVAMTDIPAMIMTFGVVAFGFYLFRCDGWASMARGLINLWIYPVFFALCSGASMMLLRIKWLRIAASVAVTAAIPIAALLPGGHWTYILKFWWLLPASLAIAVEWRDKNLGYPLQRMPANRLRRLAFYWLCLLFVVISEPVDMAFIYFQF